MNHFEYVSKSKYMPVKKELIKIINQVQDELREQFTFDYKFIGSSSRNMITYDPKTNKGYDFDINIEVNDFDEYYSAKELKEILINTFNQVIKLTYPYASCQNNTRVFTIKVYEENPCCINKPGPIFLLVKYSESKGLQKIFKKYFIFPRRR